jgi:molecular chaperone GrpE (heat shock protein)
MNKTRRAAIAKLQDKLAEIQEELQAILEEEEEYRDNIPENLQGSERYEKAEAACDNLSYSVDSLAEALDYLEEASE